MVEHAVALYVMALYVTEITTIFGTWSVKQSGVTAGEQRVGKIMI